jgi:hypothetical protein
LYVGRVKTVQCQFFPNWYVFSVIPIKILASFFIEIDKFIPEFLWKCEGSRIAEVILKNKIGRLISKLMLKL